MAKYDEKEVTTMEDVIKDLGLETVDDNYIADSDLELKEEINEKIEERNKYPGKFEKVMTKLLIVGAIIIVVLIILLILGITGVIGA